MLSMVKISILIANFTNLYSISQFSTNSIGIKYNANARYMLKKIPVSCIDYEKFLDKLYRQFENKPKPKLRYSHW